MSCLVGGRPGIPCLIGLLWILAVPGRAAPQSPIPAELTAILSPLEAARWEDRQTAFSALLSFAARHRGQEDGPAWDGLFKRLPQTREPVGAGLVRLLALENRTVNEAAALSEAYLDYWAGVIAAVAGLRDPRAIPYLLEDLGTGRMAIEGVAAFGSQALDLVLQVLDKSESSQRSSCLLTLSEMLEPKHADRIGVRDRAKIKAGLMRGASDSVYYVRISAIQGLAKVPGDDITALLQQLASSDPFSRAGEPGIPPEFPVRNAAARALQERPTRALASVRPQSDGAIDPAIIRAIVRDIALPELPLVSPRDRIRPILLSDVTLARCPVVVTGPCVGDEARLAAQREAAKGTWSFELAAAFQSATAVIEKLLPFDDSGVTLATLADIQTSQLNPAPLLISRPAVIGERALVHVLFAQTYSWLVLLTRDGGAWKVATKVLISIS